MPIGLGLAEIRGAERLERALTPFLWDEGDPQDRVQKRRRATVDLFDALGCLMACWTQRRVEEEAWLYSITWAEPPSLVCDFDLASELVAQLEHPLLDGFRSGSAYPTAPPEAQAIPVAMVRTRLAELARRVEYLMSRAADLRLSRQLEDIQVAFADRVARELVHHLENASANKDQHARLEAINTLDARFPVLSHMVETPSPATRAVVSQVETHVRASNVAKAFVEQVVISGSVNVMASGVFEWLKTIWSV